MSYNPYRKYCSYWWKYWRNMPYDTWDFLKRLYEYAPLLWEDNDYDFNSVLHIMRFKFKRLRNHIERDGIGVHSEDRVAELARVDVLLRNVMDEDPDDEWSTHYNQWHTGKAINEPCALGDTVCYKAIMASHKREVQNWTKLWKFIQDHMQGWWD